MSTSPSSPLDFIQSVFDRRSFMRLFGAAGAVMLTRCGGSSDSTATTTSGAAAAGSGVCVLTPELTIGPFFLDERFNRADLTTFTTDPNVINGVPLLLALQIVSHSSSGCSPLANAMVDVWHADAGGVFSDEASQGTAGQNFLRGFQISDANGMVGFITIYPGWYAGRTIHIEVMVRPLDSAGAIISQFTTELFFDDSLNDTIMAMSPYNSRGPRDTRNSGDSLYSPQTQVALSKDSSGAYNGSIILGVPA